MTLRYLYGVVLAGVALTPVLMGSRSWRRRLVPSLTGAPGYLAEIILSLSTVILVVELLGLVGAFRLAPITIALVVVGLTARYLASHARVGAWAPRTEPPPAPTPAAASPSGPRRVALLATSVLAADWATRTIDALNHGMTSVDTLWYHMPFAARFVQTGSIFNLHYVDTEPVVQFYPATSELLHGVGIVFLGSDFLSPLLNMGWMALTLLAAWCIGRRFGVAPISLAAAAVLLATPGLVATQPGGAYTDVVGLALFLSSIALLVSVDAAPVHLPSGGTALAALAAGLAFGTKFTFVGPVIVLTVGVWAVTGRGRRLRQGALWVGFAGLTGSFWYIRNWVAIGNPLPSLSHIGPVKLPSPPISSPNTTFGHYLFNGPVWTHYFIPGLRSSLGPVWWAILACSGIGIALVFFSRRSNVVRMVAVVGAGSLVAFIYTPQFLGLPGAPIYFVYNLRYVAPALLVGLVLLPLVPALARESRPLWLGIVLLVVLGVTQLDSTIWPINLFKGHFAQPVKGVDSLLGLLVGVLVLIAGVLLHEIRAQDDSTFVVRTRIVAALALVTLAAIPLQAFYLNHRYTDASVTTVVAPRTVAWVQHIENARIALGGPFMNLQYPYYGRNDSNYVQFMSRVAPNGAMSQYSTCAGWIQALHAGNYGYVITVSVPEEKWTRADPDAELIRTEGYGKVLLDTFRIGPKLNLSGCKGAS